MTAIPKPKASRSGGIQDSKLTETDYLEIGERIGESIEFGVEVEVTVFAHKRYEDIKLKMNNIVSVK